MQQIVEYVFSVYNPTLISMDKVLNGDKDEITVLKHLGCTYAHQEPYKMLFGFPLAS